MQLVEPLRDVGVVVEIPGSACATGPVRAVQAPGGGERPEQESGEPAGGVDPVCAVEPPPRLGQRRQGQPVPGGDRLVVAAGLWAPGADREQASTSFGRELAADDRAAVLERLEQRSDLGADL